MKGKVKRLAMSWVDQYKSNVFLKKLSIVLVIDVLVKLSGIVLLPVYLRLMTQGEYGLYNYILSIITTFSLILSFGLYVSQSKYYSDSKETRKTVLFNIFMLLTTLLMLIIIPVYAFRLDYCFVHLLFKNPIPYELYRWQLLLAIIVSVYIIMLSNFFITSEQINSFRKYNIVRLILINTAAITGLYYFRNDSVQTRLAITYIVELIVLLTFGISYIKEMQPGIDKKTLFNSMKLATPIMFSAIWGLLSNYSDKIFLEKYGSPKDLSYYYLAFSIASILYMICLAVQNIWLPAFLKEKDLEKNITSTKKLVNRLIIAMGAIGVLLFIGLFVALQMEIISPQYTPALYVLPILLLAQIINGITQIYSNYMIYFEKTQWTLFIGILASVIGFAGGYFIIPYWNIYGAAIVFLTVQIVYIALYRYLIKIQLPHYKLQSLNKQ